MKLVFLFLLNLSFPGFIFNSQYYEIFKKETDKKKISLVMGKIFYDLASLSEQKGLGWEELFKDFLNTKKNKILKNSPVLKVTKELLNKRFAKLRKKNRIYLRHIYRM